MLRRTSSSGVREAAAKAAARTSNLVRRGEGITAERGAVPPREQAASTTADWRQPLRITLDPAVPVRVQLYGDMGAWRNPLRIYATTTVKRRDA